MADTTMLTVASNIKKFFEDKMLGGFHGQYVGGQFAKKSKIATNKGNVIEWDAKLNLPRATSVIAEGSDITPDAIYTLAKSAIAVEYGGGATETRRVFLTAKDLALWNQMAQSCYNQMAESMDKVTMDLMATSAYRMRVDNDPVFQFDVVATSDGDITGITFISSSLIGVASLVGGYITIQGLDTANASRTAYCESKIITAHNVSTGTLTFAAIGAQLLIGVQAHIAVGTGIVPPDVIDTDAISLAVRQLKRNKATRFQDNVIKRGAMGVSAEELINVPTSSGAGYWVAIISQDHEYDFMRDTDWKTTMQQQDKEALINGIIKKWMGVLYVGSTQTRRETVVGVEDESAGVVHVVNILGQEAFGISAIGASDSKGDYGVVFTFKEPTDFSDYIQIRASLSWQAFFAMRNLNSLWNIGLLCGATA